MFSISTLADDAPPDQFTISRLYPALKYCLKPIRATTTDHKDTLAMLEMAYIVAGGKEAYKEHPFLTHHYCPTVSPLSMDKLSTENVIYFASEGLPVYPTIVPNAGLTSPNVHGWDVGARQCRVSRDSDFDADGERRYADHLCHARDCR